MAQIYQLPPPPREKFNEQQLQQWLEQVWRWVRPRTSTSGDAAASIPNDSTYHGVTALTAGRILTLPKSSEVTDGMELVIQDESGAAGTHNITIAPQGSDVLRGATTISSNYGRRLIIKRGTAFYCQ